MNKLGKVLFNVAVYTVVFLSALVAATAIMIVGTELAKFINK